MEDLDLLYNTKFVDTDGLIVPEWELDNLKANANFLANREPEDNELFLSVTAVLDWFENNAELEEEPWYDSEASDFLKAWEIAKELVELWGNKLQYQFPTYSFYVAANRLDQPKVRFYRIRSHEVTPELSNKDSFSMVFRGS
ncbi:hypothetical protein [Salinimonas chungwhensis]|uniref:hypothetical protein n=1 Tax=Salinimonas chungwhensis TaxID=265425 RepID=UPI00035E6A0D|nr:hypothetical protein [Salinimonas chungwhensis]